MKFTMAMAMAMAMSLCVGCGGPEPFGVKPAWRGAADESDPYAGVLLAVCDGRYALQWLELPVRLAVEDEAHREVVEYATWVIEGQVHRDLFQVVLQSEAKWEAQTVWMLRLEPQGGYAGRAHLSAWASDGCSPSEMYVEVDPALEGERAVLVTAHELGHLLSLGHVADGLMNRAHPTLLLDERQLAALEALLPRE